MSVCLPAAPPSWNNLAPTGQIFMKFDIGFSKIYGSSSSIKIRQKYTSTLLCKVLVFSADLARQATDDNTIRRMRLVCWVSKATDTLIRWNTYCFPTVTVVTGTRLTVTFIRTLPVLCSLGEGFLFCVQLSCFCRVSLLW